MMPDASGVAAPSEDTMTDVSRAIVQTIRQPMLVLEKDLTVALANRAFLDCFRVGEGETLGRQVFELGNGAWDIAELRDMLTDLLGEREAVEDYRVEHGFEDLGRRVMLVNARRLDQDGHERIFLAVSDITERERMENELVARAEFALKLIDSVREALVVMHRDLRVESANLSFYEIFRVSPEETVGRSFFEIGSGQWDVPELRTALEEILPRSAAFDDFEVSCDFPGIGRRSMLLNARQLDHMPRVLLAIRDETDRHRHAERQQLLVGELQHRVKNLLANVQAITNATLRRSDSLAEFRESFIQRLQSLARAQDLLMRGPSGTADLRELIVQELSALGWHEDGRLTIQGPPVVLSRRQAQPVAMVLHELATNTVKYGALAGPQGRLDVSWNAAGARGTDFSLVWRESGLDLPGPPARQGFGTVMIERSIRHMLGGATVLEFRREGLLCRIDFALDVGRIERNGS